jgi:hypothetical protein
MKNMFKSVHEKIACISSAMLCNDVKKIFDVMIFKAQECRTGHVSSIVCGNNRVFLFKIFFFSVVAVWVSIRNVPGSLSSTVTS